MVLAVIAPVPTNSVSALSAVIASAQMKFPLHSIPNTLFARGNLLTALPHSI